nr:protein kinase and PP2C-like domain-containing protein [Tanacetum cinerariifolium]
ATYLRMAGRPPVLPSSTLSYSEVSYTCSTHLLAHLVFLLSEILKFEQDKCTDITTSSLSGLFTSSSCMFNEYLTIIFVLASHQKAEAAIGDKLAIAKETELIVKDDGFSEVFPVATIKKEIGITLADATNAGNYCGLLYLFISENTYVPYQQARTVLEMNYTEQKLTTIVVTDGIRHALVVYESHASTRLLFLIERCWDDKTHNRPLLVNGGSSLAFAYNLFGLKCEVSPPRTPGCNKYVPLAGVPSKNIGLGVMVEMSGGMAARVREMEVDDGGGFRGGGGAWWRVVWWIE